MENMMRESQSGPPDRSYSGDNGTKDAGDFECNICFELAEEPIVTLCGHLFCWPCLYKWLHVHSHSHECPVCKALIEEEKLVPLYGRGKTSSDPRSKPVPGFKIPHRPAGQRPATAPVPEPSNFPNMGFTGGFAPMGARFGHLATSAGIGIGGLFPSLVGMHVNRLHNSIGYGRRSGYAYNRFYPGVHGGFVHDITRLRRTQEMNLLKILFIVMGLFVILATIL